MRAHGRKLESFWSRYAPSIAFLALILIAALGFARIENARYDGCQGGNLLRAGLRATEESNIKTTEATDPALFPNIPPAEFERLVDESVDRARYNIRVRYADRACGTKIDLPLTGASIVFPP
jgi:hypothetical protein